MGITALQRQELHKLLDKYEARSDYGKEEKSSRRTMLNVTRRSYPDYFHVSDSSFRRRLNAEMGELEKRGWVKLEWEKYERGNTLKRIVLNPDCLEDIYAALGREPKQEYYLELKQLAGDWRRSCPPELELFYSDLVERLDAMKGLPGGLSSLKGRRDFEDLFRGLDALCRLEQEIPRRRFSVKVFGDSKRWEQLEKPALWVLKNYSPGAGGEELEEREILAEKGLLENPRHINLAGPLVFETSRGTVDLRLFYPDLGLPPRMVPDMEILQLQARAVLTVENLTSYYHYLEEGPPGCLVIYMGGYHNAPRREILKKLHAFDTRVPFYHWGDMDLGGFLIWNHLRKSTGIPVQPLMMDEDTYCTYSRHGRPITENYRKKLVALLENEEYTPFHPLIRLILETNKTLEQEAINLTS